MDAALSSWLLCTSAAVAAASCGAKIDTAMSAGNTSCDQANGESPQAAKARSLALSIYPQFATRAAENHSSDSVRCCRIWPILAALRSPPMGSNRCAT